MKAAVIESVSVSLEVSQSLHTAADMTTELALLSLRVSGALWVSPSAAQQKGKSGVQTTDTPPPSHASQRPVPQASLHLPSKTN